LSKILDAEDIKVIATAVIIVLVIGLLFVLLAVEIGVAITIFERVRSF
jgi:hypothetical protein